MNIASMKENIIIQKLESQKDERGNPVETWTEVYRCRACASVPSGSEVYSRHDNSSTSSGYEGSEFYGARQTLLENKIKFSVRYTKKLKDLNTTLYRCIWNGREYNILSVDNVRYKNNIITITAICKDGNMTITEGSAENG
ncbi:MAG: phage head closure protein [Ruminococcus sp.]|nr:phage head closure protein [Ruminococcus sp.]